MSFRVKFRNIRATIAAQVAAVSLLVALFSLPAFSQLNLGRIIGSVTDATGAVIAGAKVTVTDQDRGTVRQLASDEAGAYAAPSLIPGNYTVRVEFMGFNISERKNVEVQVGSDARVDVVLQAGSQNQTVTVTEAVPLMNTTSATLGNVVEGHDFTDLPIIGRSYQSMLQFQPGVVTRPGGGSNGHSSNGLRSDGNNWLFEGIYSGGVRTAGSIINTNSNTGDGASVIPPDSIQEIGVSFQNKAEYGWKPGVASNVGIKSGTNSIHGTAFAVGQTGAINARNPFNPAPNPVPLLAYEQYGATIGGPIKKDKLFYYVAYEGMQFTQGVPTTHVVPTTALETGTNATSLSIPAAYLDMAAKGIIPSSALDVNGNVTSPSSLTLAQQLSATLVSDGIFQTGAAANGVFNYGFTASRDPNKNLIGKIDYHLNDKNTITGEYFWNRDTEVGSTDTVSQLYWATDYFLTGNVARASWTYLPNSTWVNEAHFGFDRKVENSWPVECNPGRSVASPNYGLNSGAATPCLGFNKPGNFALPNLSINGFDLLGPSTVQQRRVEGYWSVVDTATHTAGSHNFKFGFEMRRPYFSGASYGSASSSVRGQISFGTGGSGAFATPGSGGTLVLATPLESFLDGVPSTGSFLFGNPTAIVRNYSFGTFVQDDWRLTPRLTLNIGLRYEYETALSEDSNKLAVFNPNLGLEQVGTNGLSAPWKQAAFGANLQPRFGAVYDLGGKGKTVIRGAVGIYSNWPVWQVYVNNAALINNPTSAAYYAATGGTFTQGTGTIGSATITFPTSGGTLNSSKTVFTPPAGGLTPTYTAAGPIFPTGSLKCGSGLGSVDPKLAVSASNPANPGTCAIGTITPNMTLPYANEWTLGVQQSLLSSMSVDIAYVGNHGTNLLGATDLNETPAGTHDAIRQQTSRPYFSAFPWMGKINQISNKDYSNYNALQVTLNQRNWHGLTSTVGYTYGHALDVTQTDITQNVYPNPLCPECNYGPTGFDIRHRVTGTATYLVPGIKAPLQLLEGWKISTVVNFLGALPYNGSDATSDISGTLEGTSAGAGDRWDLFGNINDFNSYGRTTPIPCFGAAASSFAKAGCGALPTACTTAAATLGAAGTTQLNTLGCYMAGNSVIVPPAQGTFGTMNQNEFRGAGLRLWDLSLRKQIHFTERIGGEFQFDMYNVTNTPQFAPPSASGASLTSPGAFGTSSATPNVANGNVVQGSGGARRMQFGLKLTF